MFGKLQSFLLPYLLPIMIGLALGGAAYHFIVVTGLEHQVREKQATIEDINARKAEYMAANVVLTKANQDFGTLTKKQNAILLSLKGERDTANAQWLATTQRSVAQAVRHEAKIAEILAAGQKPGQTWCEAWSDILDVYVAGRKVGK